MNRLDGHPACIAAYNDGSAPSKLKIIHNQLTAHSSTAAAPIAPENQRFSAIFSAETTVVYVVVIMRTACVIGTAGTWRPGLSADVGGSGLPAFAPRPKPEDESANEFGLRNEFKTRAPS